jgi:hypothetical protein
VEWSIDNQAYAYTVVVRSVTLDWLSRRDPGIKYNRTGCGLKVNDPVVEKFHVTANCDP